MNRGLIQWCGQIRAVASNGIVQIVCGVAGSNVKINTVEFHKENYML